KVLESGEVKQDATVAEDRVWFKVRMYATQLEVVKQMLDEFCKLHSLGDDYGRALELILVEKGQNMESVVSVIQNRLPELKATVELLKDANRPAEDRCAAFEKAATSFITELAGAAGLKKAKGKR